MFSFSGLVAIFVALYGYYLLGEKKRAGFIFNAIANALWIYLGAVRGMQVDLILVSIVFTMVNLWNFRKWKPPELTVHSYPYWSKSGSTNRRKRQSAPLR